MRTLESPEFKPYQTGPLLDVWIPADTRAVPEARHDALRACERAGISEEGCIALDLALGEALANAVVHGVPAHQDGDVRSGCAVRLCVWEYRGHLIIQVHDRGPGFDPPPPYHMPPPDRLQSNGRGLPLMQMLTDAMLICRGDDEMEGSSIYLIKNLPGGRN